MLSSLPLLSERVDDTHTTVQIHSKRFDSRPPMWLEPGQDLENDGHVSVICSFSNSHCYQDVAKNANMRCVVSSVSYQWLMLLDLNECTGPTP